MVFVNEWPVPNAISKARTVDHERNAELFAHNGYVLDEKNWIVEWRLNWNGKDSFVSGKRFTISICEDGSHWINFNSPPIKDEFIEYIAEYIKVPESLKNNTEIIRMLKEAIEVNKFCFGKPTSKIRSATVKNIENAKIQYYPG